MNQKKQTTTTTKTESKESNLLEQSLEATAKQRQSIVATAASFLGVPPDKVLTLLRNVWKPSKGQPPLTDQEMYAGISMVARFGLDPIAKEVYVTRTKNGLATIIGIDGWIKILDRTDHYDGHEVEMDIDKNGVCQSVTTTIHSKTRKYPTTYIAFRREYETQGGFLAGSMPSHMLRIFSLRHAARLFTPVGGSVVSAEEARWMDAYYPDEPRPQAEQHPDQGVNLEDLANDADTVKEPEPEPEPEEKPKEEPKQEDTVELSTRMKRILGSLRTELKDCQMKTDYAQLATKYEDKCNNADELKMVETEIKKALDSNED